MESLKNLVAENNPLLKKKPSPKKGYQPVKTKKKKAGGREMYRYEDYLKKNAPVLKNEG